MKKPEDAPEHRYQLNMILGRVSCWCGWEVKLMMNGLETIDRYQERTKAAYEGHLK